MTRLARSRARARRLFAFPAFVAGRFADDGGLRVAAALSYTSLLSLVPLLTIAFAMLAAFPGFADARDDLLAYILDNLVVQDKAQIEAYMRGFLANAGKLGAVGVVGLGVTALMLLGTIETAMNGIFRVARPRPALVRVLVYWALITLGPVLIGSSFTLSGYLTALAHLPGVEAVSGPSGILAKVLPTLLIVVTFTLFFMVMPNRPVAWRHALAGATLAGLMFTFLRWAFSLYVVSFPSYQAIYGAISSIPLFLIWMYLSWAVVLIGATVTAALPEWRHDRRQSEGLAAPGRRMRLSVDILRRLDATRRTAGGAVTRRDLLAHTSARDSDLDSLLVALRDAGLVARAERDAWVLSRDPSTVTLADLYRVLGLPMTLARPPDIAPDSWDRQLRDRLAAAEMAAGSELDTPLRALFGDDS